MYVGLAACEYSSQSSLSAHIFDSPYMRAVWNETNIIISVTNDLLSLRKELRQGCIESIVPLTCASGLAVQDAVAEATRKLEASKHRFNKAATSLIDRYARDERSLYQLSAFVEVCKCNCVGNLMWR